MNMQRAFLPCMLAAAAIALASCGGGGKGLIPLANAGPLRQDFETVAKDAKHGKGDCATTEQAIAKTKHDFAALPAGVDEGLRNKLTEGIANLTNLALRLCEQPAITKSQTQTSVTEALETATSTETTATETEEPETEETESSSSAYTPSTEENLEATGGEQAPPEGSSEGPRGRGPNDEGPPGHSEDGGAP